MVSQKIERERHPIGSFATSVLTSQRSFCIELHRAVGQVRRQCAEDIEIVEPEQPVVCTSGEVALVRDPQDTHGCVHRCPHASLAFGRTARAELIVEQCEFLSER